MGEGLFPSGQKSESTSESEGSSELDTTALAQSTNSASTSQAQVMGDGTFNGGVKRKTSGGDGAEGADTKRLEMDTPENVVE